MFQLENKVAVIVGGSKGIGLATAKYLSKAGATVVIVGRTEETLQAALEVLPGTADYVVADISKVHAIEELYQKIAKQYDGIDILFANAGNTKRIALGSVTEADFDEVMSVNLKGCYFTVQRAIPLLKPKASVILNASVAGLIAYDSHSLYSAGKAAVIHLAKTFAIDLAKKEIRVNAISPGYVSTSIWNAWIHSPIMQQIEAEVPLGNKFSTPEEIARTVLFLASEFSSYITGQNIVIDGGLSIAAKRYGV